MSKLSDTQLVLLSKAAQREDRALAIPTGLKGGALVKVVDPLLKRRLVEAVRCRPDMPVWRTAQDGTKKALIVTDEGLRAIGIEPDDEVAADAPEAAKGAKPAKGGMKARAHAHGTDAEAARAAEDGGATSRRRREGTKQAQLVAMLRRPQGATIEEITRAFGWLPHTARGAIAGALKKKLGLTVASEKVEGRGRVYHVAA
ncbi:MAG: DUF3489 domain-containing protein [Rhodospirillaceae bacterium]|nr:DUF3489 domain-containing protein [Rhodospirillaceae bacterium]